MVFAAIAFLIIGETAKFQPAIFQMILKKVTIDLLKILYELLNQVGQIIYIKKWQYFNKLTFYTTN